MSDGDVYVARKSPHSNGTKRRVFLSIGQAELWMHEQIEAEPDVKRWEKKEQPFSEYEDYTFHILEGKGEVVGTIETYPTTDIVSQ